MPLPHEEYYDKICRLIHVLFIATLMGRCVISVFVDDIIITGDDAPSITKVKQTLGKVSDVKDSGSR